MKTIIMTIAMTMLAYAGFANAATACYGKKCDYVADLIRSEGDRHPIGLSRRSNPWEIQRQARKDGVFITPDEASNLADYMNRPRRGIMLPRSGNRFQRRMEADRVLRGEYDQR